MYNVFTPDDLLECVDYIRDRLECDLYIDVDFVFDNNLTALFKHENLLKNINDIDGAFQAYESSGRKKTRENKTYCRAQKNGLHIRLSTRYIETFIEIYEELIKGNFLFEIRIYN